MQKNSKKEFEKLKNEIRTILVKKWGGIGNVILGTPMLEALKQIFPKAHITVLVESEGAKEVLKDNPYVKEITVVPIEQFRRKAKHKYFRKMLQSAIRLRKKKYDLVVNGYGGYGGDSWLSCLYTFLIRGKYSVGYGKGLWRFTYSKSLKVKKELHEVERNLNLIRLIVPQEYGIEAKLNLWISEADRKVAEQLLGEWGVTKNDFVVGIHPGSGQMTYKRWNPNKFAEVSDQLIKKWDAKVIIFGGKEEIQLTDSISLRMKMSYINAVGKTTLKQTAALIERCKVFITNDTGLMHIAAAVRIPVVAIFGPTNSYRTSPYGNAHVIVTSKLPCAPCYRGYGAKCADITCLKHISVQQVVSKVERLLCI